MDEKKSSNLPELGVVEFDGITRTSVYSGGLDQLEKINDKLSWHSEYVESLCSDVKYLTLREIWEQAKNVSDRRLVTVFVNGPLRGTIYQCGNYEDGKWVMYGTTIGYA